MEKSEKLNDQRKQKLGGEELQKLNDEVQRAIEVVKRGGIILYPTDTVWGIGCDASNPEAVKRVFEIKQRADNKALIVLVGSANDVAKYVQEMPDVAYDLIEFSERPLTIVYDKGFGLAPALLGEDGSVGIRVTSEEFSATLCRKLRRPLVSTSANISGQPAPAIFSEISEEILNAVDYVVDYRRDDTTKSQPSTVMKLSAGGVFTILRP
jgi:L-threonylcarbamoyladenylate synthase